MNNTQVFNISLEDMQLSFERMKNEAGWNTNEELFWGYYFWDKDVKKLEKFSSDLKNEELSVVNLRKVEGKENFILHAEEHSIHSPQSLFDKCKKLANLAIENGIEVFDGWDVEKLNLNNGYSN